MFEQDITLGPGTGSFMGHTFEIMFMLIGTFLLGLWLGWLMWSKYRRRSIALEQEKVSLEGTVDKIRSDFEESQSKLNASELYVNQMSQKLDQANWEKDNFGKKIDQIELDLSEQLKLNQSLSTQIAYLSADNPISKDIDTQVVSSPINIHLDDIAKPIAIADYAKEEAIAEAAVEEALEWEDAETALSLEVEEISADSDAEIVEELIIEDAPIIEEEIAAELDVVEPEILIESNQATEITEEITGEITEEIVDVDETLGHEATPDIAPSDLPLTTSSFIVKRVVVRANGTEVVESSEPVTRLADVPIAPTEREIEEAVEPIEAVAVEPEVASEVIESEMIEGLEEAIPTPVIEENNLVVEIEETSEITEDIKEDVVAPATLESTESVNGTYTVLTKIEGIGPKTAEILSANGIASFTKLSQTPVSQLKEILYAAGGTYRIADPQTWPAQALLASNEEWENLAAYQKYLVGGKPPSS